MKKTNKNLAILYALFGGMLVTANCIAAKQIPIGTWFDVPVSITVGILCYPFTFLITDIIGEVWGKKEASVAVFGGFVAQIISTVLLVCANLLPGSSADTAAAFSTVLGSNWILTIGSLVACIVSQSWDVWVFHKIRDAYIAKHGSTKGGKWIWNNVGTISSQLFDSVIFYTALIIMLRTQGVVLSLKECVCTVFAYWVVKTIIALCDTPIFYALTRGSQNGQ